MAGNRSVTALVIAASAEFIEVGTPCDGGDGGPQQFEFDDCKRNSGLYCRLCQKELESWQFDSHVSSNKHRKNKDHLDTVGESMFFAEQLQWNTDAKHTGAVADSTKKRLPRMCVEVPPPDCLRPCLLYTSPSPRDS